ncbi:hypothetical protein M3Y99_01786200 [Aphelenchoides fujianensis]|nr:hypothetical protein M3Y99_01786200 [Aphelenchoides fujianensis]
MNPIEHPAFAPVKPPPEKTDANSNEVIRLIRKQRAMLHRQIDTLDEQMGLLEDEQRDLEQKQDDDRADRKAADFINSITEADLEFLAGGFEFDRAVVFGALAERREAQKQREIAECKNDNALQVRLQNVKESIEEKSHQQVRTIQQLQGMYEIQETFEGMSQQSDGWAIAKPQVDGKQYVAVEDLESKMDGVSIQQDSHEAMS